MPTSVGPNTFGEENLVFGYDLGDVANSYKGEPTVNIAAGLGLTDLGAGLTYIGVEDGWKKYSMSGTWSGGGYPYSMALDGVSFTGGQPYSVVAILKTNVESKFNYFCTDGISYVNQPKDYEGTLSATLNPDGSRTVRRVNFAYTSTTGQLGYLFTNPISGITFNPATDFVYLRAFQAEQKTHPTQFTTGTRSATQGLIDLKGTSTIDLTNVSFDSNAQMIFDGTDDSLVIGNNTVLKNNNSSIEFLIKYLNTPNGDIIQFGVGSGTYAQYYYRAYSGYSYWNWYPVGTGYGEIAIPNAALPLNKYHHIVMTGDDQGYVQFYINGTLQTGATRTANSQPANWTPADLTVGGFSWDGYSNSEIPYLKIYNRVLPASEIQQNFNAIKGRYGL